MPRRRTIWILLVVAALCALLVAPVLFRTQLAEWLIARQLHALGTGPVAFQVDEIDPTQARLRGIEAAAGRFRLAALELRYRLPALLFGEIDGCAST